MAYCAQGALHPPLKGEVARRNEVKAERVGVNCAAP